MLSRETGTPNSQAIKSPKESELAEKSSMYFLYILECSDGSLYTGITNDLQRRFEQHKAGKGGHYTSSRKILRIAYTEEHADRSSALKREAEIKSWRREKKLSLIQMRSV
jgi:putative endonuclease